MIELDRVQEVHGSELTTFRECRLQHKWAFVDHFSPPAVAQPLEFGSAFHVGMETFWNPDTWQLSNVDLYRLAVDAFTRECHRQLSVYLERVEQYGLDPTVQAEYDQRIDLGKGMLRKFIRTLDRQNFTPVAVEQEAFVPITNPDTGKQVYCRCDSCWEKYLKGSYHPELMKSWHDFSWLGLPVVYGVKVDAVLQDKDGGHWIVDWKTAGQLIQDQTLLELDGQIGSYCWALMIALGLEMRGFKYVQILKAYPKRPRLLTVPRQGKWFSTNRQQRTDYTTYLRYVQKYDLKAVELGYYDEYLTWLKENGPSFIRWFTVYKTPTQLNTIGRDLTLTILDYIEPHHVYASPGRLKCAMCKFQEPCLERQSGGDYQYILENEYVHEPPYYILQRRQRDG